jgi:hypothetical protein
VLDFHETDKDISIAGAKNVLILQGVTKRALQL